MKFFRKRKPVKKIKVGLLGGTFNPIHIGHLNIAETALLDFDLDKVIFLPCYIPPHKNDDVLPGKIRFELIEAAISKFKNFEVSDYELKKGGVSYSVETLKAFTQLHPENEYYFIIGADSLCELHTWRDVYPLLELCTFVTITRPGYVVDESTVKLKEPWKTKLLQNVSQNSMMNVASSKIRELLHNGDDVGCMLPPDVESMIIDKKLYQ
ncbi:MAG: nicotinate-nucleotide adenylyltransferase [Kiritimatiellae bacterium]|nr:nicotinate-nucleotide adenylyltransferase [Kiritimatiellia bacterium]